MGQSSRNSNMARIFASVAMVALASAAPQFTGDSSNAIILQEQRFNAGAGKFGAAYAQEDGVVFREESGGNNERIGQYSYIDDKGKTITVKYSAGINGFRILEGDHIPSGGQNSALTATNAAGEPEEYDYEYYDDRKPQSVLSTPTTPLITLSTFWVVTLPGIWLVASSQHLDPDLQSLLSQGGRAIHPARSSWIGSLKVSTSTSGLSRAEPTRLLLLDLCVMRENVQFLLCIFFWTDLHVFNKKNQTQK